MAASLPSRNSTLKQLTACDLVADDAELLLSVEKILSKAWRTFGLPGVDPDRAPRRRYGRPAERRFVGLSRSRISCKWVC